MNDPMTELPLGESLAVPERLIVAPKSGIFRALHGQGRKGQGDMLHRGDVIGAVHSLGTTRAVRTPFDGVLVAFLAVQGERVHEGQPLAWLRGGA